VQAVEARLDEKGLPVYYVVHLEPSGFVVVTGEDRVEPVVCFSSGHYDSAPDNPLTALLEGDARIRVENARRRSAPHPKHSAAEAENESEVAALRKWRMLLDQPGSAFTTQRVLEPSDPRVDPLIQSKWAQTTECGTACYNYYTPPGPDGSYSNYSAGCVGIALAQLMRYYRYPGLGVGTRSFDITICGGTPEPRALRGGDGAGGPYNWTAMPLDPDCGLTTDQRQAIGALCHDAGVAAKTDYCSTGSGASLINAWSALLNVFYFENAKVYGSLSSIPLDKLYKMVNPNLDAGRPVILGLTRSGGGHMVLCDGYGYDSSTLYHHLNMGWAGLDDTWYNLPLVDASTYEYDAVTGCIYNVYTEGSGEIISGRVTDSEGNPIAAALVSAQSYSDVTDSRGLYALGPVPSNTSMVVQVRKEGYLFADRQVTTGYSQSGGINSGNLWGVDFVGRQPISISDAKSCADGVTAAIANGVVTAVFGDWFYVESANRTSGIAAAKPGHGLVVGRRIDLIGTTRTNGAGERYVEAASVQQNGEGRVEPIGISSRALGGTDWNHTPGGSGGQCGVKDGWGLNNIGLLVRCWGRVTYSEPGSPVVYVDDGAGLEDGNDLGPGGTSVRGVRVVLPDGVSPPQQGGLVRIVGISSIETVAGERVRVLRVRNESDVAPVE